MKATVEKVFPIKGRTDFFKYVIKDEGVIVKDFEGKEKLYSNNITITVYEIIGTIL